MANTDPPKTLVAPPEAPASNPFDSFDAPAALPVGSPIPPPAPNPFDSFDATPTQGNGGDPSGWKPLPDAKPVAGVVQTPMLDNGVDWARVHPDTISPKPGDKQVQADPMKNLAEYLKPLQGEVAIGNFSLERSYAGLQAHEGKRPLAEVLHDFSKERLARLKTAGVDSLPPTDPRRLFAPVAEAMPAFGDMAKDAAMGAGGGGLMGLMFTPVGGLEGAAAGAEAAAAVSVGKGATGSTFLDLVEAGIPENTARHTATAVGVVVGAEQAFGLHVLSSVAKKALAEQIAGPVGQKILKGYIEAMGETAPNTLKTAVSKGAGIGAGLGFSQAATELLGKTIAASISNLKAMPTGMEWWDKLTQATIGGAAGGAATGGAFHGVGKVTGTLLSHIFDGVNSVEDAAKALFEIKTTPIDELKARLEAEQKALEEKIKTEEEQAEASAVKLVEDRDKEIADFHAAGGVDRFVPQRITIEQARKDVAQKYEATIQHEATLLRATDALDKGTAKLPPEGAHHKAKFPLKYQQGMIDPDGWSKEFIAPPIQPPKPTINPLAGHVEENVIGTAPVSQERAAELARARYADAIEAEAQAIVDANDKDIKSSQGGSTAPSPLSIKDARTQVANNSKPSDLKRQAAQVLQEIGVLSGEVKADQYDFETGKSKPAALQADLAVRQEAERKQFEADAKTVQDAIPPHDPAKPPSNILKRALLVGEKPVQTWTAAVDAMLVFARGEALKAAKAVLDMTAAESKRSDMISEAQVKLATLYGEATLNVGRAFKLIAKGTKPRKDSWGTYYDNKGNPQQLHQLSPNQLVNLHLRSLDPEAHDGYRNAGYTLKTDTRGIEYGEISTEELVAGILADEENGDYLRLADATLRYWDWMHSATADNYVEEYGQELPKTPNYSGQISYEDSKGHKSPEPPMAYQQSIDAQFNRKAIDPYSIREREGAGNRALKVEDQFSLNARQTVTVKDWIAFSKKQRQLDAVLGSNPETKNQIEQTFGKRFYGMVKNSYEFQVGARKEQVEARLAEADTIIKNMATGYLGGDDPTQFLRQVSGFINMAGSEIGGADLMRGALEAVAHPSKLGEYLEASTVYRERKQDMLQQLKDAVYDDELAKGSHEKVAAMKAEFRALLNHPSISIKHWGMLANRLGGRLSDALGGYAVYRKALLDGLSKEQAVLKADAAVDKTQSSGRGSQRTPIERSGTLGRIMVLLQKQNIQIFSMEMNAYRRIVLHHNDAKEVAKQVATLAAIRVAALAFTAAARLPDLLSGDEKKIDSVKRWLVLNLMFGGLATAPLMFGDVLMTGGSAALSDDRTREPETVPGRIAGGAATTLRKSVKMAMTKFAGGDVPMEDVLNVGSKLLDLSTAAHGYPIGNTARTVNRVKSLADPKDTDFMNAQ